MKFGARLPSDLPGAVFTARIIVRWRNIPAASPRALAPIIRTHLRRQTGGITEKYSVLDADAARDAVLAQVAEMSLPHDAGAVDLQLDIDLRADADSRRIAEQHVVRLRELQLSQESLRSSLLFLRDEVLAEPALGRIWWMQQHPELVAAIGREVFDEVLTEASTSRAKPRTDHDGFGPILTDFMTWLSEDVSLRRLAVSTLNDMLKGFGRHELLARLRQVSPELQSESEGDDGET